MNPPLVNFLSFSLFLLSSLTTSYILLKKLLSHISAGLTPQSHLPWVIVIGLAFTMSWLLGQALYLIFLATQWDRYLSIKLMQQCLLIGLLWGLNGIIRVKSSVWLEEKTNIKSLVKSSCSIGLLLICPRSLAHEVLDFYWVLVDSREFSPHLVWSYQFNLWALFTEDCKMCKKKNDTYYIQLYPQNLALSW